MKRPFKELRSQMLSQGLDQDDLARKLLVTRTTIFNKLSGVYWWTLAEMYTIMDLLNWPYDRMHELFPKDVQEATATSSAASALQKSDISPSGPRIGSASGKGHSVALVDMTGENDGPEIRCPHCDAKLGLIVTTHLVMVSKA